jgi:hypothetical protein
LLAKDWRNRSLRFNPEARLAAQRRELLRHDGYCLQHARRHQRGQFLEGITGYAPDGLVFKDSHGNDLRRLHELQ